MNIGIIGHMRAGKTTMVGDYFATLGFARIHTAETLRRMLRPFLIDLGYSEDELYDCLEGDRKREPLKDFPDQTFTTLQQTLGTEWGRVLVNPEIWNHVVKRRMARSIFTYNDSIRFPNEAQAIIEAKGILIKVERPGNPVDLNHASESHIASLPYHFLVVNDSDYAHVERQLNAIHLSIRSNPWENLIITRPTPNA